MILRAEAEKYLRYVKADRALMGGYPRCPPDPAGLVASDEYEVTDKAGIPHSKHTGCLLIRRYKTSNTDEQQDAACHECLRNEDGAEVYGAWSRQLVGALDHMGDKEHGMLSDRPLTQAEREAVLIVSGVVSRIDPPPEKV